MQTALRNGRAAKVKAPVGASRERRTDDACARDHDDRAQLARDARALRDNKNSEPKKKKNNIVLCQCPTVRIRRLWEFFSIWHTYDVNNGEGSDGWSTR